MFTGIAAFRDAPGVCDYPTAIACYEACQKTPTGRQRAPQHHGYPMGSGKRAFVRMDGSDVVFRLWNTDVITWCEDGSVEIENYGSVSTSAFANHLLPHEISLSHPTTLFGATRGHCGFTYRPSGHWRDDRTCGEDSATFRLRGGEWHPDEEGLDKIGVLRFDRSLQRKISQRYPFADFTRWLGLAPQHMNRIEHRGFDVGTCLAALEKRDFLQALMHMPTIDTDKSWGSNYRGLSGTIPVITQGKDRVITLGCVRKLKLAAWFDGDAAVFEEVVTMPTKEYDRNKSRLRELEELGMIYACDHILGR